MSSAKQQAALKQSQAIMKLTPKYRAKGMGLKEAWAAAKKEFLKGKKDSGQAGMTSRKKANPKKAAKKKTPAKKKPASRKQARKKNPGTLLLLGNPRKGRRNPADSIKSMVEIYGQVLDISAVKGQGAHYQGEPFIHEFKREGTKLYGLPAGAVITLPDGDSYKLETRTLLALNKRNDLWDLYQQ
ncbi:MAG: hypothetical protein M0Z52_07360 [Actinomycetota bacterium]|nr:hypothetical protein [Actinomycetota bacterium]